MKKESGIITIITIITILFMLAFLISTFTIISNRRQVQAEVRRETEKIYESNVKTIEAEYDSYFAELNEVIPISTVEQLLKVGSNKYISDGNKIYKCTQESSYKLMNDIELNVTDTYINEYPDLFGIALWDEIQTTTDAKNQIVFEIGTSGEYTYNTDTTYDNGKYFLEVWGAEGGTNNSSTSAATGGKGGYSKGTISLNGGETIYIYIGGAGGYYTTSSSTAVGAGGTNGGGNAGRYAGGGGRSYGYQNPG